MSPVSRTTSGSEATSSAAPFDLSSFHMPFFTNPLLGKSQASAFVLPSSQSGIPISLTHTILYVGARLTQMAGILLGLPQTTIARAIVIFWRFYNNGSAEERGCSNGPGQQENATGPETDRYITSGGSLAVFPVDDVYPVCLIIASKASYTDISLRDMSYVSRFLQSFSAGLATPQSVRQIPYEPEQFYVSERILESVRARWFELELAVLNTLGFDVNVALPHQLLLPYSRALGLMEEGEKGKAVIKRAWEHLNSGLLSPQMVYLTHQPCALTAAALYLAARQVGVKLPEEEWWEVFDTDREELGFLVVAILSLEKFAEKVAREWHDRDVPTDLELLEQEMHRLGLWQKKRMRN